MSGPDWCRWYPNRWITGTIQLTLEQRGFFVQVVSVIMDLGSCSADDGYLARLCNCNRQRARRLKSELIHMGKLYENGGKLRQNRAETERKVAAKFSEMGRNRAAKRWNVIDLTDASAQCQPHIDSEKKERKEPCSGSESTTQTTEYDSAPGGAGNGHGGRYAFEGAVVKLTGRDFKRWREAYPDIDLIAELTALDDHYSSELTAAEQKRWFTRCSQALANRQERAATTKRSSQPRYVDPVFTL